MRTSDCTSALDLETTSLNLDVALFRPPTSANEGVAAEPSFQTTGDSVLYLLLEANERACAVGMVHEGGKTVCQRSGGSNGGKISRLGTRG